MSEQKPCLCGADDYNARSHADLMDVPHAINCPKHEAKAPEPECLPECHPSGYLHALKCPKAMWNNWSGKGLTQCTEDRPCAGCYTFNMARAALGAKS